MTFCPQCGRSRAGDALFCGTCGHKFALRAADTGPPGAAGPGEPLAPGEPTATVRPEQIRWDTPVAPPRWDAPPGVMHPETVVAGRDSPPAADAGAPPPGGPANELAPEPESQWAGWENTVTSGPARASGFAAGYASPPYTPPAPAAGADPAFPPPQSPFPPQTPWTDDQGQRPARRMTWIFVAIAVIVVLGAGGGAYALTRSQRPSTPSSQSTGTADTGTPTVAPPTPTASATDTAPPSPSASPSPTPSPTHTGTVQVAAAAANDPAEPQVLAYVTRYFAAINAHNYNAYQSLLDGPGQQGDSQASFDSGYGTTKDSNEVLTSIEDTGGGDVTANVTFTSRQSTASSVDGSPCDNWHVSLFLVPQGSSYVKSSYPPSGYHAAYTDC